MITLSMILLIYILVIIIQNNTIAILAHFSKYNGKNTKYSLFPSNFWQRTKLYIAYVYCIFIDGKYVFIRRYMIVFNSGTNDFFRRKRK